MAGPFALRPIGRLRTPFATLADCPRNGRVLEPAPACLAEVDAPYQAGLRELDGFSHLIVLYWLDAMAGYEPVLASRTSGVPPRGVFATRAPRRPNPIGLAVVAFDGFAGPGRLRVRYLDCVDGTPLIDIKPYLAATDSVPEATLGWLALECRPGEVPGRQKG